MLFRKNLFYWLFFYISTIWDLRVISSDPLDRILNNYDVIGRSNIDNYNEITINNAIL